MNQRVGAPLAATPITCSQDCCEVAVPSASCTSTTASENSTPRRNNTTAARVAAALLHGEDVFDGSVQGGGSPTAMLDEELMRVVDSWTEAVDACSPSAGSARRAHLVSTLNQLWSQLAELHGQADKVAKLTGLDKSPVGQGDRMTNSHSAAHANNDMRTAAAAVATMLHNAHNSGTQASAAISMATSSSASLTAQADPKENHRPAAGRAAEECAAALGAFLKEAAAGSGTQAAEGEELSSLLQRIASGHVPVQGDTLEKQPRTASPRRVAASSSVTALPRGSSPSPTRVSIGAMARRASLADGATSPHTGTAARRHASPTAGPGAARTPPSSPRPKPTRHMPNVTLVRNIAHDAPSWASPRGSSPVTRQHRCASPDVPSPRKSLTQARAIHAAQGRSMELPVAVSMADAPRRPRTSLSVEVPSGLPGAAGASAILSAAPSVSSHPCATMSIAAAASAAVAMSPAIAMHRSPRRTSPPRMPAAPGCSVNYTPSVLALLPGRPMRLSLSDRCLPSSPKCPFRETAFG